MVENTKKVITKILNNPKKLKKDDLKIIKNILDNYPFFSPVRILYLLFSKKKTAGIPCTVKHERRIS